MNQRGRALEPADLRVGDILLLDPGKQPNVVSEIAIAMDRGDYSHAVILGATDGYWYTYGANQTNTRVGLASGVNAIALGRFNSTAGRRVGVVRHDEAAAAADAGARAAEFVESWVPPDMPRDPEPLPDDGPSEFGWGQLILSSMACFARQLKPGTEARRVLWNLLHEASDAWLSEGNVCTEQAPAGDEVCPHKWDCSHFVDHVFCVGGASLTIDESDPDERRPGRSLVKVIKLIARYVPKCEDASAHAEVLNGLLSDDMLNEAIDDEGWEQVGRDAGEPEGGWLDLVRRVLGHLFCRIGVSPSDLAPMASTRRQWPQPGDRAWPPFISPRMLQEIHKSPDSPAGFVGRMDRGKVPDPEPRADWTLRLPPRRAGPDELDEIVDFIAAEQQQRERNIIYLGVEAAGIRAELDDLEPGWRETVRMVRGDDGALAGVVVAEWDEVPKRAWIHGPWVRGGDDEWAALARALVDAVLEQLPETIVDQEIAGDVANARLAALAAELGWPAGEINHALTLDAAVAGGWETLGDVGFRDPEPDDLAGLERLHELEFPASYYSTSQLLERAASGEQIVLVADSPDSGGLLGYAAGRVAPDGEGYIDFVAVVPEARGTGVGRRLVVALSRQLLDRSTTGRVSLTVQDRRAPARALYASLGFRPDASFLGYRSTGTPVGQHREDDTSRMSPSD